VRALLKKSMLSRNFNPDWRFYPSP
jgi:hypothetical protein